MSMFQKATRKAAKARIALVGPSGSGKTLTALLIAKGLGGKVAVIDSERRSASKYAGDADTPPFDVCELDTFSPQTYIAAIKAAAAEGYDIVIVDSLSHAWTGKDGALEQVDRVTARSRSHNKFSEGWREVTPLHNELVDTMLRVPLHVIVTMRVKTEYVIEEDKNGKKVPRKVGLTPIQRAGVEYEFDVVGDMDPNNTLVISKSRCRKLTGETLRKPTEELGWVLAEWLSEGEPDTQPSTPSASMSTQDEPTEILALVEELGVEKQVQDMLRRAGASTFADLPKDKMTAMMAWLQAQRARKGAPPAAQGSVPTNGAGLDALASVLEGGA